MMRSTNRVVSAVHAETAARSMHTTASLCTTPLPSAFSKYRPVQYKPMAGLEKVSAQYAQSSANYNQAIFGSAPTLPAANVNSNTQVCMKMLQAQLAKARKNKDMGNILLSPISLAQSRVQSKGAKAFADMQLQPQAERSAAETNYAALLEEWGQGGDVTLQVAARSDAAEAAQSFANTLQFAQAQEQALQHTVMPHQVKMPFPLHETTAAAAASSTPATAGVQSSLGFRGYLAPKFTSPLTKFPNYFFNYAGAKTISHMMVKSSKAWYVEAETFQMIDLPYLNDKFVATLVLPRVSADRTIQDHQEEFAYDQTPRRASTVDEVLALLATPMKSGGDVFNHHCKYMSLMQGLVGLPGFKADCTVDGHRSVLALSPHGLDVGARALRQRPHQVAANFTALFDHPFLFFVRGADPKQPQILFAGVINDVFARQDFHTKFPLPAEWREYKEQMGQNIQKLYEKIV